MDSATENCNGVIPNGDVLGISSKREKLIIDTDPGIGESFFPLIDYLISFIKT